MDAREAASPSGLTIAILSCTWDIDFMARITAGVQKALEGKDVSVHLFQTCDTHEWGTLSVRKEAELFSLFDPSRYDGLIIAANGYGNIGRIHDLGLAFQASGKPVVTVSTELAGLHNVGINNAEALYRMTSHLIEVHGAKTFRFLAGPADVSDSNQRLLGFRRALADHGLGEDAVPVHYGTFTVESGSEAYAWFREQGCPEADAVVSANDGMILGYCAAAEKDGLSAPRDYLITGFDNSAIAEGFIPALTTISQNLENTAQLAVESLLRQCAGGAWEEIGGTEELILRASCGCPYHHDYHRDFLRMNRKYDARAGIGNNMRIGIQELIDQNSPEGLHRALPAYLSHAGLAHMAILLNPMPWSDQSVTRMTRYEDRMILCSDGGYDPDFPRSSLLPASWEERTGSRFTVFMALYDQDLTLGYAITDLREHFYDLFYYRTLMGHLGVSVDSIRQRALLHQANRELQRLYVTDSLTSLLNRSGYARFADDFFQDRGRRIAVVMADLDRLKDLNDLGGHDDGDYAILAVADALRTVFPPETVKVRMGGDEFLVLADPFTPEEWQRSYDRARSFLREREALREPPLPVPLNVSMGYVLTDGEETLEHAIQRADEQMYLIKPTRRRS